jgi:glycine cleavage system H lipoate-binding protein
MKEYNGHLWTEPDKEGRVKIGFTKRFIEERLGECFHVMQADIKSVRKGSPMLVIETNDGLESLKSPLTGAILVFNAKARNFPDRLTEEDTILQVLPEGVTLPQAKKKQEKTVESVADRAWNQVNIDELFNQPFQGRGQPVPPAGAPQVQFTPEMQQLMRRQEEAQREALRTLANRAVAPRRPR